MKRKSRVYFCTILLIVFTGVFYKINAAPDELDKTFAFTGFIKEKVGGSKTDKIFGTVIQPFQSERLREIALQSAIRLLLNINRGIKNGK